MKKTHFFLIIVSGVIGLFLFNACVKDVGQPIRAPYNLHVVEGFENSTSLPSGWSLYNPDNDAAWEVVTTVAHSGKNCVGFNNCSGDGNTDMTGRRDRLITPVYNFAGTKQQAFHLILLMLF